MVLFISLVAQLSLANPLYDGGIMQKTVQETESYYLQSEERVAYIQSLVGMSPTALEFEHLSQNLQAARACIWANVGIVKSAFADSVLMVTIFSDMSLSVALEWLTKTKEGNFSNYEAPPAHIFRTRESKRHSYSKDSNCMMAALRARDVEEFLMAEMKVVREGGLDAEFSGTHQSILKKIGATAQAQKHADIKVIGSSLGE